MKVQAGIVSSEGDELYYKVRGTGKPILFIPQGGGNADDFVPVGYILAEVIRKSFSKHSCQRCL